MTCKSTHLKAEVRGPDAIMSVNHREEDPDFLEYCYRRIWQAAGATAEHAAIVAKCISHGDRMGKTLQGLGVFEAPIMMLRSGNLDIAAAPTVESEGPTWVVIEGHRCAGQLALMFAVERAVEKAREVGIAIAISRNHNDAGCYSAYTAEAMTHGMVAIATNNSPPLVSPWGAMQNVLGAAPFSLAAPGGDTSLPIIVDVQFIDADDGHISEAALTNSRLSGPYLVDSETGALSDDPHEFFVKLEGYGRVADARGATVFSQPRLYALNCAAEVLSAFIVPGAVVAPDLPHPVESWLTPQPTPSVGGSFVLVMDPSQFGDMSEYRRKADRYVDAIKGAKRLPDVDEIMLPGERGQRREQAGEPVRILEPHWTAFEAIADDYGLGVEQLRMEFSRQ